MNSKRMGRLLSPFLTEFALYQVNARRRVGGCLPRRRFPGAATHIRSFLYLGALGFLVNAEEFGRFGAVAAKAVTKYE